MSETYYFAFGSNMNIERLKKREINFSKIFSGYIKGYKLVFDKKASGKLDQTYANIQKEENSIVEGILYQIDNVNIEKLDIYEGVPKHYLRKEIEVNTTHGLINAWVYIAHKDMLTSGKPTKNYLSNLLNAKDYLSENYYKNLCRIETSI